VGWDPPKIIQFFTVTAKVKIKNWFSHRNLQNYY
jgi:hypothetical protein